MKLLQIKLHTAKYDVDAIRRNVLATRSSQPPGQATQKYTEESHF